MGATDETDRSELLELITPTLSIAIENAVYRTGLEQLVQQRTAELTVARDQLAGAVEQMKEAQGARERFFGNISHEIGRARTSLRQGVGRLAVTTSLAGAEAYCRWGGACGA